MSLAYLYEPNKQYIDRNGGVNVGGFLRVYLNGTDDHATTYKNFEGTLNAEDIVLDNNGRAVVICEESQYYRIEVYNRSGGLLWTQYPIKPESGSSSLQRINIFSSDHSVDVEETYVAQTDFFNFDLGVKYENLPDKPTIPAAQVQSDWNQANSQAPDYIKNKPYVRGSYLITQQSDWLTFDGTNNLVFGAVFSSATSNVAGDKIRMIIPDGQTKYRVEGAKQGVYSVVVYLKVKWDGVPLNKKGWVSGYELDFSRNFAVNIGTMPALTAITASAQDFYGVTIQVPASFIDAPAGIQIAVVLQVTYLGDV